MASASAVEGSGVWPCGIRILESGSSPVTSKHFHSEDATTLISSSSGMNLYSVGEAWRPLREGTVDIRLGVLCVALLGKLWLVSMLPGFKLSIFMSHAHAHSPPNLRAQVDRIQQHRQLTCSVSEIKRKLM